MVPIYLFVGGSRIARKAEFMETYDLYKARYRAD